jgi:hypothetical protein
MLLNTASLFNLCRTVLKCYCGQYSSNRNADRVLESRVHAIYSIGLGTSHSRGRGRC